MNINHLMKTRNAKQPSNATSSDMYEINFARWLGFSRTVPIYFQFSKLETIGLTVDIRKERRRTDIEPANVSTLWRTTNSNSLNGYCTSFRARVLLWPVVWLTCEWKFRWVNRGGVLFGVSFTCSCDNHFMFMYSTRESEAAMVPCEGCRASPITR